MYLRLLVRLHTQVLACFWLSNLFCFHLGHLPHPDDCGRFSRNCTMHRLLCVQTTDLEVVPMVEVFFLLNEGVVVFCLLCCFVKKDIKKMFKKNLLKPFRCNSTFSILVKAHFNVPTSQSHNSVYLQLSIRCCGCKYRLTLLHHFIFFDLSLELSLFSLIITTRFIWVRSQFMYFW